MVKILVVDDEAELCAMEKEFFEHRGYQVVSATDPLAVMAIVDKEKPQLVLLDIIMEKMSGLELLKRIKDKYKEIKVIMVSVVDDPAKEKESLKLGADAYVKKPFITSDLESVVMEKIEEFFGLRGENNA